MRKPKWRKRKSGTYSFNHGTITKKEGGSDWIFYPSVATYAFESLKDAKEAAEIIMSGVDKYERDPS